MMRLLCAGLIAMIWASSAAAAGVSGDAGVVSDYRYRGVSLSDGRPAVQGSLTIEHGSGLYAELWGSTLGDGNPANSEGDLTAGYGADLSDHVSIDLSGSWYLYPKSGDDNYAEATALVTATHGNASASAGVSYIPRQRATRDETGQSHDNVYLFGTAGLAVPKTPLTLKAGLGYERGAFDEVARGGKWDWTIGGEVELKPARFGLAYVGSNADGGGRHALVATAFLSW
jgi:uncharacterized protein (TIGR02001 family)